MFTGKKVTVGVAGGIAAYKAAEIVSWLNQQGAYTQVAMTQSATRFITPLTMKTLSGHPVAADIMSEDDAFKVPHIDVADCDLLVIVPATANFLAKAAHGLADDILSAAILATKAPILCAPAMHVHMFSNPATQENLAILQSRGWKMIQPGFGRLACGTVGQGRLADVEIIKEAIREALVPSGPWQGKRVLVTAGPTYEFIDPVRFIGNRSSGKMGYALAEAARDAGAEVTLILGPCQLPDLPGGKTVRVTSAEEMDRAVWSCYEAQDMVFMAAAVSDYRPESISPQKTKKGGPETLSLVRNPDILASLGKEKGHRFLVGFAAETENLPAYAAEKLRQKNLDLIVANNVASPGAGFDGDTNIVTMIYPKGEGQAIEEWPVMSKREVARHIVDFIVQLPSSGEGNFS